MPGCAPITECWKRRNGPWLTGLKERVFGGMGYAKIPPSCVCRVVGTTSAQPWSASILALVEENAVRGKVVTLQFSF